MKTYGDEIQDIEATEFAIHLLVPEKYLDNKCVGRNFDTALIDEISDECAVEQWVVVKRLQQHFKTQKYLEKKSKSL